MTRTTPLKWFGAAALTFSLLAGTSACSDPASGGSGGGDKKTVSIVGFSILKTANKQLIADFQKTDAGKDVEFKESYGASGDQARAVIAGLKADEVHLSLEPDMTKLTDEGLVADDWKDGDNKGIAHAVRRRDRGPQGQPQEHPGLGRPRQARHQDRDARTPAPPARRSGTSWRRTATSSRTVAARPTPQAYLKKFLANVAAFPGSGKDATTAFEGGTGDVLLSYENEAIQARAAGADFDYIIPDETLLIQNPGAVTKEAELGGQGRSSTSS